ncbi:MAG: hypothetical protein FWF71_00635 [Actinomycetia bacterium]|nr:hypothetical protein [Actinomycetes bacterium]
MSVLKPYAPNSSEPVLDVAEVVALEKRIESAGTPLLELMRRAGRSVSEWTVGQLQPNQSTVVLCGSGNNGGDGWVIADDLVRQGYPVALVTPCPAAELLAEPARTAAIEVGALGKYRPITEHGHCEPDPQPVTPLIMAEPRHCGPDPQSFALPVIGKTGYPALQSGTPVLGGASSNNTTLDILVNPDTDQLVRLLDSAVFVVDAILGTGFNGSELREPYAAWVNAVNAARGRHAGLTVVAVDVPSGLSAQTGKAATPTIMADATITMLALKPGLLGKEGQQHCGKLMLARIAEPN